MTIKEVAVRANREITENLIRAATAMPGEKVTWRPLGEGRDALDLLAEVAHINALAARVFEERAVPPHDPVGFERAKQEADTPEKAVALLRSSADRLAAAIESFPEGQLGDTVRIGPLTKTFAELMVFVYAHSSYHFGQVNYIQTLYGDREMHV